MQGPTVSKLLYLRSYIGEHVTAKGVISTVEPRLSESPLSKPSVNRTLFF